MTAAALKVVLVTGASSGIGKACAEHLLRSGYRVIGTQRQPPPADGHGVGMIAMDVNDDRSVAEGIERPAEVEKLSELGVRYGQGYFFARPAPLPLPLLVGATAAEGDVRV